MKELSVDNKVDILGKILEERYSTLRTIRARVQDICIWSLGLLVGAGAWLLQSDFLLYFDEAVIYIVFVVAAYVVLRWVYFADIESGFKKQQRALVKLEKTLHLYTKGYYSEEGESVLPEAWEHAGTEQGEGQFFRVNYALLNLGMAIFIATVLLKVCW